MVHEVQDVVQLYLAVQQEAHVAISLQGAQQTEAVGTEAQGAVLQEVLVTEAVHLLEVVGLADHTEVQAVAQEVQEEAIEAQVVAVAVHQVAVAEAAVAVADVRNIHNHSI